MVPAISVRNVRRSARRWERRINRRFSGRSAKLAGAATCAALAIGYLITAWWIVFQIRVGPVVATLTETNGVHSGDVIGIFALGLGVVFAIGSAMLLESGLSRNVSLAHRRR